MAHDLILLRRVADLRAAVASWRAEGDMVALVPTMGALHRGHLSLVEAAHNHAERVIATIFVNPKQFDDPADLEAYPRSEADDVRALRRAGVDAVYAPPIAEVYPQGFRTRIRVEQLSEGLCGGARPGHFDGVATVVAKLLLQAMPDVAVFGEKDYQQLQIIRRMAIDLDFPVDIVAAPLMRDDDGLALSSRNQRLSAAQRASALALPRLLFELADALRGGAVAAPLLADGVARLLAAGFAKVDYLELRAADLTPLDRVDRPARLLAAGHIGAIRLIDNVEILPTRF